MRSIKTLTIRCKPGKMLKLSSWKLKCKMDLSERACIGGSSPPMRRLLSMSSQSLSSHPLWCKGGLIIANKNTQSLSQRPLFTRIARQTSTYRGSTTSRSSMISYFSFTIHDVAGRTVRKEEKKRKTKKTKKKKRSTWFDRLAFLLPQNLLSTNQIEIQSFPRNPATPTSTCYSYTTVMDTPECQDIQ